MNTKKINKYFVTKKLTDIIAILVITLTGVLFLSYFKLKHSMTFINLDELLWMYRSRFFIDGILSFNFSGLIQSSQPGIMVMWICGPFMNLFDYNFNFIVNFIQNLNNSGIGYNIINDSNQQLYSNYKEISFLFNVPILGIIFAFIPSLYYLLVKLGFKKWPIIFSLLLIATTPYYIYFTTPTDKLVGIFSVLSILSLLIYASKKGGKRFLTAAAILCSWAALTKLSALFLFLFGFFVLFFYNTKFFRSFNVHKIKIIIKDCLHWLVVFFITSIIFLPTLITDPHSVLSFFAKESSERSIAQNHDVLLNLKIILAYLSDSFIFSFNLFVIIIFILFLFLIAKRMANKKTVNKEILSLAIYFILFFIAISFFSKTYSFRYLVPVLIIFQIISGVGLYEFSNIFIEKNKIKDKKLIYLWSVVFILISQGLLIYHSELERIENFPKF